jgi:hypothetical protein
VSLFYQASVLTGILVGASFIFSPISPINLFETEAPATHFLREVRRDQAIQANAHAILTNVSTSWSATTCLTWFSLVGTVPRHLHHRAAGSSASCALAGSSQWRPRQPGI